MIPFVASGLIQIGFGFRLLQIVFGSCERRKQPEGLQLDDDNRSAANVTFKQTQHGTSSVQGAKLVQELQVHSFASFHFKLDAEMLDALFCVQFRQ